MSEVIVDEVESGIVVLTMNRPERLNALGAGLLEEMRAALTGLDRDPQVRCVILTGAGRAFCSGADVKSVTDGSTEPDPSKNPVAHVFRHQEQIASIPGDVQLQR